MGIKKVELFWLFSYLLLCIQYMFPKMSEPGVRIGEIFLFCFILLLPVALGCHMMLFISSLVQSIVYKISGYGFSPVLIYPVIIGADRRRPIQLFYDMFKFQDPVFPERIFTESEKQDWEKIAGVVKKAQKYAFVMQETAGIGLIFVCLFMKKYYLAVAAAFLAYSFYELAKTDLPQFKGLLTLGKYTENEYFHLLLAKQAVLYTNKEGEFYERAEKIIAEEIPEGFMLEAIVAAKHMYMIKIVDPEFIHPDQIKDVVRDHLVIKHFSDFANLDIGEEKFDLLKMCICYSIIVNDNEMKIWIAQILRVMAREEETSLLQFQTAQYYLDLLEGRAADERRKNRPLRKHQFYRCFANYRKNDDFIVNRIESNQC